MMESTSHSSLPKKALFRLYSLCVFFGLGSFLWGYNIGIIASIYVSPGFLKSLHSPTASQKGLITAIYYLGTWLSYVFLSGFLSDRIGRRWTAFIGTVITCVGAAVQTGAGGSTAFAMMIIGRIISGVGNAMISSAVPLYLSEIAPAGQRGSLVVINHIGMVSGLSAAFWCGYGLSHWNDHTGFTESWRTSVAIQFLPALIFLLGLPFCGETPRWLVEQGRITDAQKSLQYLRGHDADPAAVAAELASIQQNVELHHNIEKSTWTVLFTDRDLFARLWRAALLQFMAQMCGATAIKYYLPTNFLALGLGKELSLLASGIESSLKVGCTIMEMLIIDKVGRRRTLLLGSVVMSVACLLNGALPQAYPNNSNHASDYACVVFIFFFSFGYSVGFGPNAWVYGTEIFPTHVRAKGLNIAASAGAIGSIVVAQIWPVAIQNIGAQTYFIFFAINAVSVAILWVWYPETKGRSLEKMDALFEGGSGSGSEGDVEAVGGEEKRGSVGVCEVPALAEKN